MSSIETTEDIDAIEDIEIIEAYSSTIANLLPR